MVDWVKVGVAVGFGAADKYAQDMDASAVPARKTAFRNYSDYLRIAGAVGTFVLPMFAPKYAKVAEAVGMPAIAFLTQSVWDYAKGTGRSVTYTPVRRQAPAGISQRYPAPELQNEFKNIRL